MEKECEKEYITYMYLNNIFVHLKVTQYGKSTFNYKS